LVTWPEAVVRSVGRAWKARYVSELPSININVFTEVLAKTPDPTGR
jgi:hypothetical protein